MADDTNEDSWLYGTSNPDSTTNEEERAGETVATAASVIGKAENEALAAVQGGDVSNDNVDNEQDQEEEEADMGEFEDPAHEMEEDEEAVAATTATTTTTDEVKAEEDQEKTGAGSDDDVDDDDDSDDDINVVIGDTKAAASTYNIKQRSNLLAGPPGQEKTKPVPQGGKFSMEDFEGVGSINGVAAHEFSIDSLEEKPWRKPGADITDYFNYGFNEETWRAYCERQKRFRVVESGVGLASLTQNLNPLPDRQQLLQEPPPVGLQQSIIQQGSAPPGPLNEHIPMPLPSLMPPPSPHQGPPSRFGIMPRVPRPISTTSTKENAIQVMTAECREYSRPGQMPLNFNGPGPADDPFYQEPDPFDYGYEPTQESQWGNENPNWVPTGIKELTPGPNVIPPPQMSGPPGVPPNQMNVTPTQMSGPPPQMRPPHPQAMMPNMVMPNMNMGPPPPMGMMMGPGNGPPMRMPPMGPPRLMAPNGPPDRTEEERDRRRRERDWEREKERERESLRSRRERSRSREKSRRRSKSREKERDKDRDKERNDKDRERERERDRDRDRERERDRDRNEKIDDNERSEEERERRRRERDRERERERERSRRERSRSREKSRRRSKSREKERERSSKTTSSSSSRSDKKKSHRKEDEE
ncbi:factor interacting with poly(A) polymerase 1 isoform 1-T6 [Glossina fuscipes fuscipes]